jgi:hypothetical protein
MSDGTTKVVIAMSRPGSLLTSEFDSFLFAPIGEEPNGMLLSVISALARLDIDPWREAARLAQLQEAAATKRLAAMIAQLADGSATYRDPPTIAARLVALLPRGASSTGPSVKTPSGGRGTTNWRTFISMIAISAVLAVVLLGAQAMMANNQTSSRIAKPSAPASDTVPQ